MGLYKTTRYDVRSLACMSITYTLFIYLAKSLTDKRIRINSIFTNAIDVESRDYFYATIY